MNKDEADKCKEIAKKAIAEHNYEKALRFLHKSTKLFANSEAEGLIKLCELNMNNRKNGGNTTTPSQNSSEGPYKRPNTDKPADEDQPKPKNYTADDVKICKDILAKTNYYEILGIEKNATEAVIKKSYRKIALRLHPDKNNAPKATDAFKKVSQAYMCLSDSKKRQIYDEHGTEENFRQNYRQYFREEEEFDPFDLFDLFTGHHGRRVYRQRRPNGHHHPQGHHQVERNQWQQFLPLLFVLFLMIIANLGGSFHSGPSYSFSQSSSHKFELETSTHGVKYFVDQDTYNQIRDSSRVTAELEGTIEQDFYRINTRKCRQAKETQGHWVKQARYYTKGHHRYNQYMDKANSIDLSS